MSKNYAHSLVKMKCIDDMCAGDHSGMITSVLVWWKSAVLWTN